METRILIASIALVLISATAMAVVSVGPITFPSNPGTTYFEPAFEFGGGTTASHRIALTFNSGVGKITEVAMVPTFDNCLPLSSRSATDTANCSAQEFSKDSKCQVYAQKVTANAPRCVIKISYLSGTETKSKFFEANNDQTIKIIDDPTGTITPTNCAAAIAKINDKPLSQVPFYIDPTVALKVDFIVDPKCDFSKYSLDVWALDASSDITAVLKDKKANRLKQFLFASGDKTNIFTTKSISIAAPLNNAKYYKNPETDVLPENKAEITARNASLTFSGFIQAKSGNKFYLIVENAAKKDSPIEPTDWKDSQTIEATFTKPQPPVSGCSTVLQCLVELNQNIVKQLTELKKKIG
ncbi:MAG: hypothetical protein Q7R70_04845 [Candidatus Diapherotrites archaeon]|nr:hypothetical protein [Candidatus Diapherotrites archaeon]